jgi:hypothetical protein
MPVESVDCPQSGRPKHEGYWNDSSSSTKQPRILNGIDNIVLLVSSVYVCDGRHKVIAHDEIVLANFPLREMIPFTLLHKTGFTRELLDMCSVSCRRGINFYSLESLILEWRWETFARQQDLAKQFGKSSSDDFSSSTLSN